LGHTGRDSIDAAGRLAIDDKKNPARETALPASIAVPAVVMPDVYFS